MNLAKNLFAVAAAAALSFALSGCASSDDGATDPADDTEEVEATSQDLVASPGEGCHWVLRRGRFCPRILGSHTANCSPAPRYPGYHWQKICRET